MIWYRDEIYPESQSSKTSHKINHPKNPWTLQWKGLNLYTRGPGPQNSHFWGVRILEHNARNWCDESWWIYESCLLGWRDESGVSYFFPVQKEERCTIMLPNAVDDDEQSEVSISGVSYFSSHQQLTKSAEHNFAFHHANRPTLFFKSEDRFWVHLF